MTNKKDPFINTANSGATISVGSTGNISFGNNNIEFQLRRQIEGLTDIIHRQEDEIRRLQALESQGDLSDKEIKFLLMRCHPDKNPNSNMAVLITQKLIRQRKK